MKNFAPFTKCIIHINDDGDGADNFDIIMSMYNLTEYSDNYSDTSGSLLQFRRNESTATDALLMFLQLIQHLLNTDQFSYKN